MPRSKSTTPRPTVVTCLLCGRDRQVGPVGTIPSFHPECKRLWHMLNDVEAELSRKDRTWTVEAAKNLRAKMFSLSNHLNGKIEAVPSPQPE